MCPCARACVRACVRWFSSMRANHLQRLKSIDRGARPAHDAAHAHTDHGIMHTRTRARSRTHTRTHTHTYMRMCVCAYIHISICICIKAQLMTMGVNTRHRVSFDAHAFMRACIPSWVRVAGLSTQTCTHVRKCTYMNKGLGACTHTSIEFHTYIHTCLHIHIHIRIHNTHAHAHTHTHRHSP